MKKVMFVVVFGVVFLFILGFVIVYFFGKGFFVVVFVGVIFGNMVIEVMSGVLVKERVNRRVLVILMGVVFVDDILVVYFIGIIIGMVSGNFNV